MKYLRDGRAPVPDSEVTSRVMSANKGKDTGPEITLRKALRENGMSGYRLHWKGAPGRPDICYPGKKLAIFIHGCYWHRCPKCNLSLPRSHTDFWRKKFEKNKKRDKQKLLELEKAGWFSLLFWECDVSNNLDGVIRRILELHQEQAH